MTLADVRDLAMDLRREIRKMIREGKTDQEVRDFLVGRYGDFVLYRPPVKPTTWLLWGGPFVLMLGDELYLETNHAELARVPEPWDVVCAVQACDDVDQIRKNYALEVEDGRIVRLVEKPVDLPNRLLGCGTYCFTPGIFADARGTFVSRTA